jgi:hypothetical protein
MSVFDMFKQAAPAAPATPAAASAATNPTVPSPNNSPVVTGDPTQTTQVTAVKSPLDQYGKLWDTDPNAKPNEPFKFNSDPNKLMETAKTVDFRKIVSPATMSKIQAGGTEAQTAMMDAMNSMTQMVFAQSSHATSKIVESALQAQEARFNEMLPDLIKRNSSVDNLRTTNPLMADPAMAPMIQALHTQFTNQYPKATAAEINEHVNTYLNGAADRITSLRPVKAVANKRQETDWGNFFTE